MIGLFKGYFNSLFHTIKTKEIYNTFKLKLVKNKIITIVLIDRIITSNT